MNNYTLKNPTAISREYMVEKFNIAFNMNITYGFFKNKLDEFKKSYKRWKALTHKTGITVDPHTSFINASNAWWTEQEFRCKLTKSLNRKPPVFWDVMQRCLVLHDVQSQSQHFARQRREQLIHEHGVDEEGEDYSDSDSEGNNEVGQIFSQPLDVEVVHKDLEEAHEFLLEVVHEEVGDDNPLKQQYKTASLASENSKDKVFNNFVLYFIDIAASTDEDKVQLLEAMSGVSRNNQDMPKQLENFQQGGSSGTTPTNVQYGFSVGGQGDGATTETPPIIQQTSSSGLGFTNYFETGQMPQTPRRGGLFNIWGTPQGSNASHHSDAFRICQLQSQDLNNLSYEERIELWNLENEQFEELVIQPALNYYDRYFKEHPFKLIESTLNISIEESVAMFLRICGHNEVQIDVGLRFGQNQETVQRKFREVLTETELLACDYIRTPTRQELYRIPERLQVDRRYWPYFSGFVGAMDGTHVCVKVKPELQGMYWNRHDNASLNIMAICDLNMLFTYIWNGVPSSCHDTAVLQIAQQSDFEFPLPPSEKYYLVDSCYPNKQGFLALYRSSRNRVVRYHMSQFYPGPPPRNKHELFNQCHTSLRSVIERTVGV
ncbi:unnamed protein product [Arabidopsis thaliana]|uniref:(thale cress) hypothetical protein n=1 Tax=Arabidopsis thaliana TaxID=3702 RepID=A0A7G2ETS3_ARATH|nr:unnamed protein product [Arabidopsis thaliana]